MHQKHRSPSYESPVRSARINKIRKEILKTLLYSDLFKYPLTGDQIFQYVGIQVKGKELLTALKTVPYLIVGRTIYYHLPKHQKNVAERLGKEKWNIKKIQKTKKISQLLSLIPTIRFIGISGSLALKNAEKNADADLFFICAPHTVWFTRFIVYAVLQILGVRREREKEISGAICANMFMDERSLAFPRLKQNLYIAHEIAQVIPIIDKKNYFNKLLVANQWMRKYFPNMKFPKRNREHEKHVFWLLFRPLEYVLFYAQLWYMRQHKTREITTKNVIAFHPVDYEKLTLTLYNKRSEAYGV